MVFRLFMAISAVFLLSACAGSQTSGRDAVQSYYEDMNYVEIDGMTFVIGDTINHVMENYPDLESDDPEELWTEGIDQITGHYLDDPDGEAVVYASVENRSGEKSSSYDSYIYGYDLDFNERLFAGIAIFGEERDVKFPPMVMEVLEDFYTYSEENSKFIWVEYEKYKDKLVFVPVVMWNGPSKQELFARIVIYKDQTMTEGLQYEISFLNGKLVSFSLLEDEYTLPGYEKETSNQK